MLEGTRAERIFFNPVRDKQKIRVLSKLKKDIKQQLLGIDPLDRTKAEQTIMRLIQLAEKKIQEVA